MLQKIHAVLRIYIISDPFFQKKTTKFLVDVKIAYFLALSSSKEGFKRLTKYALENQSGFQNVGEKNEKVSPKNIETSPLAFR